MRRADVNADVDALAFDFFYWFSRFEFALKENAVLASHAAGARASPGWDDFVKTWCTAFQSTPAAQELQTLAPKRQVVGANDVLQWMGEDFSGCNTELAKVLRCRRRLNFDPPGQLSAGALPLA